MYFIFLETLVVKEVEYVTVGPLFLLSSFMSTLRPKSKIKVWIVRFVNLIVYAAFTGSVK